MGLEAQWDHISDTLPADWERVDLRLAVPDEKARAQAATLLGPLAPGRVRGDLRLVVARSSGVGPQAARRLFARLDEERIAGRLTLVGRLERRAPTAAAERPLAAQWDDLVARLPEDWSDLLCRLELESSDHLPRAALDAAPLNPSRPAGEVGFDFRVARRFGYGTSPQMTRRCLERLDEDGIPGEVSVLRALSDTQPVATQGPVWYVDGKVL